MKLLWIVAAVGALAFMPCRSDGANPAPAPAAAAAANPFITVYGAVERQGRYDFEPGMTVNDTLKSAGGAKANANLNKLKLYRKDSTGKSVEIHIPLEKAKGFPLKPGDVIIVQEKLEKL